MRPITDIRRDRLRQLIDEAAEGNQARFAAMIDKSRAYVGFWLTDPSKPHAKAMGHEEARRIEARFGKAAGWLDTDPESQPAGLDLETLRIALVALKEAAKAEDVEIDLYDSAPIIAYAYRERRAMRSKPTKAELREFDNRIRAKLQGDEGGQWRRASGDGARGVQEDAAKAPKGRRGRK